MSMFSRWSRKADEHAAPVPAARLVPKKKRGFERLEKREMLSADPLNFGAVYYEDALAGGTDSSLPGDQLHISFNGGAEGSQLTSLTIELNPDGGPLGEGDIFFDTANGGAGESGSIPLSIVSMNGIDSVTFSVNSNQLDGTTTLTITFVGFDAGETLIIGFDVDEISQGQTTPTVEGREFEGSTLTGNFHADTYYDLQQTVTTVNQYDGQMAGKNLGLPPDSFIPPGSIPANDYTAGGAVTGVQTPLPITISGHVFEDADIDSHFDAGEEGIANVGLELYEWNGQAYVSTGQTTVTNADGFYEFTDVLPGQYRVVETQPAGFYSVGAEAGNVDGVPHGVVTTPDVISEIVLVGGDDSVQNNFAEARPSSIDGFVYHDADNDGIRDAGESGIAGVTLQLLDENGNATGLTATTDADGYYLFDDLQHGEYSIAEVQPSGYLDGKDTIGNIGGIANNPGDLLSDIQLLSGTHGQNYNFGELLPGSISGRVHADLDGDCTYDPGDEAPIAGVTVHLLDASGNILQTTTTDASGQYVFANLAPGTYGILEVTPQGFFDGGDKIGSAGGTVVANDNIQGIVLASGTVAVDYNFCEKVPASISGNVHGDLDGDCEIDPGEPMLAGVRVDLLDASGNTIATTYTDVNGNYLFDNLAPGEYGLREYTPDGYIDGGESPGSAGGVKLPPNSIVDIILGSGVDAVDYNFCEIVPASLSGTVFVDVNNNGVQESGDAGIGGVTLELLNDQGQVVGTTTTNANGDYQFNMLRPGTYTIREVQPSGFFDGIDTAGSAGGVAVNPGDQIQAIVLAGGVNGVEYNFAELAPSSLAGSVFGDLNSNCTWDPGEAGIANVTVQLLDASGNVIRTTTTDTNGHYRFDDLPPGTYGIHEVQPAGFFQGCEQVGTGGGTVTGTDTIGQITIGHGQHETHYDFGERPPASISGRVFQDGATIIAEADGSIDTSGRNGRFTSDDTPIRGVTLYLFDANGNVVLGADGLPRTAVTNGQGRFHFDNLAAGTYSIRQVQPGGFIDWIDTPGNAGGAADPSGDEIANITLAAGQHARNYHFSELRVQQPAPFNPPEIVEVRTLGGPNLLGVPPAPIPFIGSPPIVSINRPDLGAGVPISAAGGGEDYTWHLSILDGGSPREAIVAKDPWVRMSPATLTSSNWNQRDLSQGFWLFAKADGDDTNAYNNGLTFGMLGGTPVTGDFNGDGITDVGVYVDGQWYIDLNANGRWDEGDLWAELGRPGDIPVTGDWNGDGKTDIGVFGPPWEGDDRAISAEPGLPGAQNEALGLLKNMPPDENEAPLLRRQLKLSSTGEIRTDLIDHSFSYGHGGDIPIAGDWNGDGTTKIGVFREGKWLLDIDGNGRYEASDIEIDWTGHAGQPVVGDFNGDGITDIGLFHQGRWHVDTNNDRALDALDTAFEMGGAGDVPMVGDWDGDGIDEAAIYRQKRG